MPCRISTPFWTAWGSWCTRLPCPGKQGCGGLLPASSPGLQVLLNVNATPGRQAFTLAHELAHALYRPGRLGGGKRPRLPRAPGGRGCLSGCLLGRLPG
ncbi:ImmA/IrrE family metallo-endopeptidase [Calidithermus timidus]|uniref:ImmA/IrrE family metallo-endopeptidase n=1 Tax=Calidithermus timidus TaxID=307124 RepID=UPI000A064386